MYLDILQSEQIFLTIVQSGDKVNFLVLGVFTQTSMLKTKYTFLSFKKKKNYFEKCVRIALTQVL